MMISKTQLSNIETRPKAKIAFSFMTMKNVFEGRFRGAAIGGINDVRPKWQPAFIEHEDKKYVAEGNDLASWMPNFEGFMFGILNEVKGAIRGVGIAALNSCKSFKGVMIGIFNIAEEGSRGVQIGFFNSREDAPWYARTIPFIAIRWSDKKTEDAPSWYLPRYDRIEK